jgi:hypothetical protein
LTINFDLKTFSQEIYQIYEKNSVYFPLEIYKSLINEFDKKLKKKSSRIYIYINIE